MTDVGTSMGIALADAVERVKGEERDQARDAERYRALRVSAMVARGTWSNVMGPFTDLDQLADVIIREIPKQVQGA